MRQVVSTIQAEQSAAIRYENARVISVVGGAGSGKTSIAMHPRGLPHVSPARATRSTPAAYRSFPPAALFRSTYPPCCPIWEKRTYARARCGRSSKTSSARRSNRRSSRRKSCCSTPRARRACAPCATRAARRFCRELRKCAESFSTFGPNFANVWLDGKLLIRREELRRMYKDEFKLLTPAQRLERVRATLETRMASWEGQPLQAIRKAVRGPLPWPRIDVRQQNGCFAAPAARARPAALHAGDQGPAPAHGGFARRAQGVSATSTRRIAKPASPGGRTPWPRPG